MSEHTMLQMKSKIDSLTGLLTLHHFLVLGKSMLDKGFDVTVLVIDLNCFKQINDTFGYIVGNSVLIQVANYLKQVLGDFDNIIARLGGDEFIVAVKNYPEENENKLSDIISVSLSNTSFHTDRDLKPLKLSFSIGEAKSKQMPQATMEALLNSADKNMYLNKFTNYNTIAFDYLNTVEIPDIYRNFLKVLAEKDMYTYVHSIFTANNAAILSEKLNLPKNKVRDIYMAGLLHDIGKLLLPNDILKKPTRLSKDEYEHIKHHVNFSLNVLHDIDISQATLNAIKYHHFRWDGLGYPEQDIQGEDMPIEGRILQIADAYTAMTIKRLYRNSLSIGEAIDELMRNCGTQFDPVLVELFIGVIKENTEEFGSSITTLLKA